MKTVILIDDDAIVRASLKTILINKGYDVIATGKNADEGISLYLEHRPDIILMDIRMSASDENSTNSTGLDATREILRQDKNAKILLVTTFHDKQYIDEALSLGCKGYILKENISGISSAIEAILSDKIVYDSKVMETLIQNQVKINTAEEIQETKTKQVPADFSEREISILELVAKGLNNKEIADTLYLSEGTVRNYISSMLSKLELRDRTQLAIFYYQKKQV